MKSSPAERGARGEKLAARYLQNIGYEILHKNLRLSRYEVDLICRDGDCLVFVEVKYSRAGGFGHPATWIDERKRERLRQAAQLYLRENDVTGVDIRFDAVTIYKGEVDHYKNAF